MTETRARRGEQLNVRIPKFARDELRKLKSDLQRKDGVSASEPDLVAALIHAATRARAVSALRLYEKRRAASP